MKKSKFSEEQIAYALRQVESGTPAGRRLPAARRQRSDVLHLEEEIRAPGRQRAAPAPRRSRTRMRRLKRLVADLSLDKHILTEALRKKV